MNALDIIVINQYSGIGGKSNSRFRELCSVMAARGAHVELITSDFMHSAKKHKDTAMDTSSGYSITHIPEPGYSKNVSLSRLFSHRILAKNLALYLENRQNPDVIYCTIPSPAVASVALKYAKKNGVRLIFDVQDLWPEAFELVIKPTSIAKSALIPLRRKVDKLYREADEIITVSETYSNRVARVRGDGSPPITTYLGTNLRKFDTFAPATLGQDEGTTHLVYIGTLGHSYNLPLVFEALRILRDRKVDFMFHVMGTGPFEDQWKDDTQDLGRDIIFHGRLDYSKMVSILRACDIAINPIRPGAAQSIVNKVCDYAAAGLPVINTQDNDEYRRMLIRHSAGINCESTATAVANAIDLLIQDSVAREKMGSNSRGLAEKYFDRSQTYSQIVDLVFDGN